MLENEELQGDSGDLLEISDDSPVILADDSDNSVEDETVTKVIDDEEEQRKKLEEEKAEREEYSKRVQKRFDKFTYKIKQTQAELDQRTREIEELKAQLTEVKSKQDEDINQRRQATYNQQLSTLKSRRIEAFEAGDFTLVDKLDDELFELRSSTGIKPAPKTEPIQQPQQQPVTQALPTALAQWEADNQWLYDEKQAGRRDHANAVFQKMLTDEGYDADDPDTYEELDARLKKRTPPPSPGGVDRGGMTSQTSDTKGFTPDDRVRMQGFGLDPDNPIQRAEWLKNKRS